MKTYFSLPLITLSCSYTLAAPSLKLVTSGLKEPVWATSTKSAPNYFYILEKPGTIKIYDSKTRQLLSNNFIDLTANIRVKMNEQGLLGMAFCPDFSKNGEFYLYYTDTKGDTKISRFRTDPKNPVSASPASEQILLSIDQPYKNHNGGWIGFGTDRCLYIATGDGGSSFDPKNRAQDLSSHLGKLLRINVIGHKTYAIPTSNPFIKQPNIKPEIYAYGLRNPWRCCWNPSNGDFYVADVGQREKEEINVVPKSKLKGANFGWRLREGDIETPKKKVGGPNNAAYIQPVYTYGHSAAANEGLSITGGFVYRGSVKELRGKYFFADFANPRIWSINVSGNKATNFTDWTQRLKTHEQRIFRVASFAEDHAGEMYVLEFSEGKVYKFSN
ncbi:PQQ-dependent sugar dehydrogenase [Akkermansiaceae bacterium]|nr:PQQ-dependent sugar dehydrogenase [Akkermansiaceae bacterium]